MAAQTEAEFREELLRDALPQLEALRTRAGFHLAPGFRYEKHHASGVDRLLDDLIETLTWGCIEYEAPPPPPRKRSPTEVVWLCHSLHADPALGSAVWSAKERAKAVRFWLDTVEAATKDRAMHRHLAEALGKPKRTPRARKAAGT